METTPEPEAPNGDERPGEVTLIGTVERFTFRNADNGFAVVRFAPQEGRPLSAIGTLAQLAEGQEVRLTGMRSEHPRYGPQLEVRVAEASMPTSSAGIIAYLSSSLVKGIGPATAEKIVDLFGDETLRVIEEEPSKLRRVKGLGQRKIDELVEAVRAQKDVQEVLVFLRAHGLGQGLAARIVKRYGQGASALIQANPYRLADDVIGVGFRTADRLASSMGMAPDAPERLQAGALFTLTQAGRDGHSFLPDLELGTRAAQLLGADETAILDELPALASRGDVVMDPLPDDAGDGTLAVYPRTLHQAEIGVARALSRLLTAPPEPLAERTHDELALYEKTSGMTLPEGQRQAVLAALVSPVSVITGGPGVGKTTIVRALAEILARRKQTLLLAAPTGRAAKRLEESTGTAATTIHRLLEFQGGTGRFMRNAENELEGDLLVVDETSMLDVQLAYNLFRAIPRGLKVALVGDIDQLPAVGPGNVLGDILASDTVPMTRLTQVFRQAGDSRIVATAHGLLEGEIPESGPQGSDFFVVEAPTSTRARELIREMVVHRIPKAFGLDPLRDVQVITPMYRGEVGADALNKDLQAALNPAPEGAPKFKDLRRGDKVMQVRNDHDNEVYNGDVGKVTGVDSEEGRVFVRFGNRELEYRTIDLDQLVPAYAISVHRSQGSEYPAVVIPVATDHFMMLRRNLLYTAITRGKQLVVLVGSPKALEMAVSNHQASSRYSGLRHRLVADAR